MDRSSAVALSPGVGQRPWRMSDDRSEQRLGPRGTHPHGAVVLAVATQTLRGADGTTHYSATGTEVARLVSTPMTTPTSTTGTPNHNRRLRK